MHDHRISVSWSQEQPVRFIRRVTVVVLLSTYSFFPRGWPTRSVFENTRQARNEFLYSKCMGCRGLW